MAPAISVRAGRAYKVPRVPEVKSGQWRPLLDEGEKITLKNRGCGYEYMTYKWHQMHHEQHPSYILPLDLKIHPKIVKQNMNT